MTMIHNITWTYEQHQKYAAEQQRRAQRENVAQEARKERDDQRPRHTR